MADYDWLRADLGAGLQRLYVLRLQSAPYTPEELVATAQVWLEALLAHTSNWTEAGDRPRIRLAFSTLMTECERWPNPRMLIDRMGPRFSTTYLPPPPLSPEVKAANLKRIEALRNNLKESTHG